MENKKAADRADTRHIQHLLERVNAKEGYITATQLNRFVSRPHGAMLPKGCIEIRPIADFIGVQCPLNDFSVQELVLDPSNRPCVLGIFGGERYGVLHDGALYGLHFVKDNGLVTKTRLIGFHKGQPVVRMDKFRDFATDEKPESVSVWCGARMIGLYDDGVNSLVMRSNGELWHSYEREPGLSEIGCAHVTKQTVQGSGLQIAEDVNGDLYMLWQTTKHGCLTHVFSRLGWEGFQHLYCPNMQHPVLERLGKGMAVHSTSAGFAHWYYVEENGGRLSKSLSCDNYLRGYSYSSGGRFSYVAQKAEGECIRFDGKYLAIFDHVSPVFEKDGDLFYYATVDGYLFLMRTPK